MSIGLWEKLFNSWFRTCGWSGQHNIQQTCSGARVWEYTENKQGYLRPHSIIGSDRSSRNADLRPFSSNLSRAVNLHLSRSEINQSTQGAIREHSDNTQRAIRVESNWGAIRALKSESCSPSLNYCVLLLKSLHHLSTRGAMPGSRGRHSFTRSAVMPILSAENKTLTILSTRLINISLPQFCAGDHNVSCACIHEPKTIKVGNVGQIMQREITINPRSFPWH